MTNMDKLYEAVEARGPVCVGLDPIFLICRRSLCARS